MTDSRPIAQVPWQVTMDEFIRAADDVSEDGACCMFLIDESIPKSARSGYAALVIAYARASEPVWFRASIPCRPRSTWRVAPALWCVPKKPCA